MMIFQSIGIQIFSLMYLTLILVAYLSKKRFVSVENSIFKVLLIFTMIELGVDISINYSIKYADIVPNINSFLCRLSLFGYHIWAAILMLYVLLIGNKKKYKSIKELYQDSYVVQVGTIIVVLLALVVFLLPLDFTYDVTYRISYIVGICTSYTYLITILYLVIILISILINKNKISFSKRIPIFVFIITSAIFLPIQRFNADVPVLIVPLMAYAIMIMYFTLENPDVKLIDELNELKFKAEEVGKVKTKFLDNVSYNMKSPMVAIMGHSQTLLTENLTLNAKNDAESINQACKTLLEMVDNTLDISRIESGLYKVNNEDYDLRDILKNINLTALTSLSNDKVKFIMNVNENIPHNLIGDYDKLLKVLNNVLSNSIKYTNVGKITIDVDGNIVNDSLNISFRIKDTGIGIKKEDQENLFEKFDRIENIDTKGTEGTGLGLSLSKKIIESLGGSITFESTYGAGSIFIIKLSQKVVNDEPIGKFDKDDFKGSLGIKDYSNIKALVIDENKYSTKVIERMLGLYKIKVDSVSKADEYIDLLKNESKYNIIFIDNKFTSENLLKSIQTYKNINNKSLKVIALSQDSLDVSKNYFINKGYDDYLIKPIDLLKVDKLLNHFFNKEM